MRAPLPEKANDIYNYTLIPQHMNQRYSVAEIKSMSLHEP